MEYAPIVLFTYNRLDCLKKTIEALQQNLYAEMSEVHIFSDGPKDAESDVSVKKVREYLKTITGFASVNIINRQKNLGLANNIIDAVTNTIQRYGAVIVLEDDLITGKYFLKYMNDGLNVYREDDEVISIHGYGYLSESIVPETYFIKTADNLGWATWGRGWELFETDENILLQEIKRKNLTRQFDRNGSYPFTKSLESQAFGETNTWAIRWYASAFLNDKFTLYPKHSLVYHIGDGPEATNYKRRQGKDDPLSVDLYQGKIEVEKIDVRETMTIGRLYNRFLKKYIPSLHTRVINKLERIFVT
jgi:glycosyltransferase involved in cell wall biosynthesis